VHYEQAKRRRLGHLAPDAEERERELDPYDGREESAEERDEHSRVSVFRPGAITIDLQDLVLDGTR
jgi:hypothetical protein